MLIKIYTILQTKINNTRQTIQDKHPTRLGIFKLAKLFILEISLTIAKYFLILFKNPPESFKILVNQPALAICPYSYTDHKSFQKRLRIFSLAGLTTLIAATVITSLIINLTTGPIFQSKAATYTFNQTNWQGGQTSNNATHTSNQTGWTEYSTKDANLTTINSGADLQLTTTSSSATQTSDTDFNGGSHTQTAVSGSGNSASVILGSNTTPAWGTLTIDNSANNVGQYSSIDAFDANTIFVSYYDATDGDLKFIKSTNGGFTWSASVTVDSTNNVGQYSSIDAISATTIVISYYDVTGGDLEFAKSTDGGATWPTKVTVDSTGNVGKYSSIHAVDANTIFISYQDVGSVDLKFAKSTDGGSTWPTITLLDGSATATGGYTSIYALDASNIFIAYSDYPSGTGDVRFIKSNNGGSSWSTPISIDTTTVNVDISIYASDANTIYISYTKAYAPLNLFLNKSTDGGTTWSGFTTIDSSSADIGDYTSISGIGNTLFVSYYDTTNGDLKYAKSTDGGSTWPTKTTVDSANDIGQYTSISVVDANNVFISYYDVTNGNLKFAKYGSFYYSSGTFTSSSIDTGQNNISWGNFSWNPITQSNGTGVQIEVAGNTDNSTWNYTSLNAESYPSGPTIVEGLVRQDCTGYSNCFTSLSAWETAYGGITSLYGWGSCTVGDLTCVNMIAIAKIDGIWTNADTTNVIVSGWTTGVNNYIRIYTTSQARHNGKWNSNAYRLIYTDSGCCSQAINVAEENVRIDGLQIYHDSTTNNQNWLIGIGVSTGISADVRISNSIIKGSYSTGTQNNGINMAGGSSSVFRIWNNIIYDWSRSGITTDDPDITIYAYNNTVYHTTYAYEGRWNSPQNFIAKNNIAQNCTDCFLTVSGAGSNYNISSIANDAPGANSKNSTTVSFIDTANADFHLASNDTAAKDSGVSLSSDTNLFFTTDIDNTIRTGTWDIGADEQGMSSGAISSTLNGSRYLRYRVYFSTTDTWLTSSLDDITVSYTYYPASQTLTSSAYNSTDAANIIGSLAWTEDASLPAGATVTASLRTASSSAGLTSASWNDFTNATTNCTKSTGTVTCPLSAIPSGLKDGVNDQWLQYKVTLTSTGLNTPTFSDTTIQYVVNAPPQFDTTFNTTGVTATQNSDGTVTIQYQIRDPDTITGTATPNAITPSFEYSTNGGTDYSTITSTYLASTDLQNKTVGESSYTLYTATWSPKAQLGSSTYVTNAKIRVTVNDNEAANNTANAATANFTLDTTNPVPGSPSLSVNPNSQTPTISTLTISATDNSSMQMKVGLASDLSDASWENYSVTKTITLQTDPDTVYIQFKDSYANTSSIVSATTPETPSAMMIQDTSNLKLTPPEYRLFAAWKVIQTPNPGFKQYNVLRSQDNTTFIQIATITDINTNYYGDSSVTFNQTYYYKVSSQDNNNNISFFSQTIQAKPDGIQNLGEGGGGTDGLPPTISNVTSSNIQTTQATINWTTDELSNSTVGYSTDTSFGTESGVASYVTSHQVTLTNLTPNTTYKFQVKSIDPTGNQSTSTNPTLYTFTTSSGPKITNVTTEDIANTTAKIIWYTDIDSNSYVVYSTNSNLSSSTQTGTASLTGANSPSFYHQVTLINLTQGTNYYYYVKSTDNQGNIAINNNGLNYYTFKTTQDSTSPTISDITVSTTTPDTSIITWTTNEPSTSQIEYGKTTSYGLTTTQDIDLALTHIVSITSLTPNTTYNFKVKSKDSSGNESTSTNQTFTTLKENQIKQDQIAPTISSINVGSITSNSVIITFITNESCLGEVSYGIITSYDKKAGETASTTTHSITLGNLSSSTTYHYQAKCRDVSDNIGSSTDQTFTTLAPTATGEGGKSETEKRVENLLNEKFSNEDIQNAIKKLSSPPTITGTGPEVNDIRSVSAKITWTTDKKSNGVIVYSVTESQIDNYKSTTTILESGINTEGNDQDQSLTHEVILTNLIPNTTYHFKAKSQDIYGNITTSNIKSFTTLIIPLISDVTISDITLSSAVITWHTSVISTGYLEYGKDTNYGLKKEHEDITTKGTTHTMALTSLDPTTTYHFRIKGTSTTDNSLISSEDYTFNTQSLPEITKESIKKITDNSAKVTFTTNIPTDTQIFYRPLKSPLIPLLQRGKADLTKDHELELTDLEFGQDYDIQIKAKDAFDNQAQKQLPTFTTGIDITPPTITLLRTENALIPGKKDKVQTIISWKTDEPSTTQITYQEGIDLKRTELKEKTPEDKSLNKDHVVVLTTLKPGTVYQLKAISQDNQQNQTISNNQTMLTPKQQESVFQVIMKNLEDVFGWVKRIR